MRIISFSAMSILMSGFIGWIFWTQELQYALPTPVPANFVDVAIGDRVDLPAGLKIGPGRYVLLHFFNSDCPCSRFNMQEFKSMAHRYRDSVQFYVILQSDDEEDVSRFHDKYELGIPVVLDKDGAISDACGIYATPQAVLLDGNSVIFFKGNYNASRYCTRRETRFVEIAMDSLLKNKPLPLSVRNAVTEPYGCTLPSDEDNQNKKTVFTLF
jgi:hypothetical protein